MVGAAQRAALEAGEAGRQLLRQEGETARGELAATAARVAELLAEQDAVRQRHELAIAVEERTRIESAEAELRKVRVCLLWLYLLCPYLLTWRSCATGAR